MVAFLVASGSAAFAQTGAETAVPTKIREAQETFQTERKAAVTDFKESLRTLEADRKAQVEKLREDFKVRLESAKDQFETRRKAEQAELKVRLEKIKDVKKKEVVERLDNRFTELNQKLTNHWLAMVTRIENALTKVSARADKAATRGADVTVVRTTVEKAKTAIAAARVALQAQLAKTYPINVTTEDQLRSVVSEVRNTLNKDLKAVKELVQTAHKAVVEANRLLKGVPKVDDDDATVTQ
ncbi:MAG: hypothetical protein Q8P76_03635 [bacterium]|nr:hypothetical protein [bacterium]